MRLYLLSALFLCSLLDALASLPSGADYYGRVKDATPIVTNAWQSVQRDVEGLVDAKVGAATNAVAEMIPSIVTNEVVSATNDPTIVRGEKFDGSPNVWNIIVFGALTADDADTARTADNASYVPWSGVLNRPTTLGGYGITDAATKVEVEAIAKDLEKLPTHEAVTNIVRNNIGTVWDAQLGVAWQARMHNGHLYYIAVTNRQEVAE